MAVEPFVWNPQKLFQEGDDASAYLIWHLEQLFARVGLLETAGTPPMQNYQLRSEEGQPNGYASLDATGKVPVAQIQPGATGPAGPTGATGQQGQIGPVGPVGPPGPTGAQGTLPDMSAYQTRSEKGQANGYPMLGTDGLVPASQLPPFLVGPAGPTGPQGPTGPAGPAGTAGPGGTIVIAQGQPLDTWTITHNLGAYPAVSVVDTGGTEVIPTIVYTDTNTVTLFFGSPTSGKVYLN